MAWSISMGFSSWLGRAVAGAQRAFANAHRMDDKAGPGHGPIDARIASDPDVVVYRMSGAQPAGLLSRARTTLDSIGDQHGAFVLDFGEVLELHGSNAKLVANVIERTRSRGVSVIIFGATPHVRQGLVRAGIDSQAAVFVEGGLSDALPVARLHVLERQVLGKFQSRA